MLNLSEDVTNYIDTVFKGDMVELIKEGMVILERFHFPNYEEEYTNLIYSPDTIDPSDIPDMFRVKLEDHLRHIVEVHQITLSKDYVPTLTELLEICNTLLIVPNLEDMSFVRYRALSDNEPKETLVELLERYSSLGIVRSMEIVENVSESFIEALVASCGEECQVDQLSLDRNHLKYCNYFFEFIENSECLGLKFFNEGYGNKLTLDELLKLITFPIDDYLDDLLDKNPAQAALDVLSLLIITRDQYELPLVKFKDLSDMFTSDTMYVTRLTGMMTSILNDFSVFLTAKKQEEELNND